MSYEDKIVFPDHVPASRKRVEIPPALKYITTLLYRSGTGLSIAYVLLLLVIQPLLEVQYQRRGEYLTHTLRRCRGLLRFLGEYHPRLPTVAIKRGEKFYSDAQCQTEPTEEDGHTDVVKRVNFVDEELQRTAEEKSVLQEKLVKLQDTVEHYNKYCCDLNHVNPFSFQIKKFQGRVEAYAHAQLFTGPQRTMAGKSAAVEMKNEIRAMKGLYLTGQV